MSMYRRKNSLRLKDYDYSREGAYFITTLAYRRLFMFGEIDELDFSFTMTSLGELVESCWQDIPNHYPQVELDTFVVMPNHFHGILIINPNKGKPTHIGTIIGSFKSSVTRLARQNITDMELDHPIWHRGYHDHIIRTHDDYLRISDYVANNPQRWLDDTFYDG